MPLLPLSDAVYGAAPIEDTDTKAERNKGSDPTPPQSPLKPLATVMADAATVIDDSHVDDDAMQRRMRMRQERHL